MDLRLVVDINVIHDDSVVRCSLLLRILKVYRTEIHSGYIQYTYRGFHIPRRDMAPVHHYPKTHLESTCQELDNPFEDVIHAWWPRLFHNTMQKKSLETKVRRWHLSLEDRMQFTYIIYTWKKIQCQIFRKTMNLIEKLN